MAKRRRKDLQRDSDFVDRLIDEQIARVRVENLLAVVTLAARLGVTAEEMERAVERAVVERRKQL